MALKFFFFLYYLIQKYLKKSIQAKFLLYFKNYKTTKIFKYLYKLFNFSQKKSFIKKSNWLKKINFFNFIVKTLLYKDSYLFLKNLSFLLTPLPIFFYKKIFSWIVIVLKFLNPFFFFLKIEGIYFSLKGKLGLKGGQKKRSLLYKFKKTSFSNTQLKLSYTNNTLQTKVGTIGLKFFIFY